ncbi:GAMMACA2 [Symbiodinium sp. CCMP2456]|nr:GAMMACA2 [Symbiodinium sp. CCMP2456]
MGDAKLLTRRIVKKTYQEADRLHVQRQHASKYANKASRFRRELAPTSEFMPISETEFNMASAIALAAACGALALATYAAWRRGP